MSDDAVTHALQTIDQTHSSESASTRRQLVGGAAAALGSLGLLGFADAASAAPRRYRTEKVQDGNSPQAIFDVTAKFEALATIINTVGFERKLGGDAVTQRNIEAAAREELLHYQVLVDGFGAKPNVTQIWVPDRVFSSRTALLNTTQAGDGIFINAYLIATTAFGHLGYGREARVMAEFMGVEAVHRAVARQSLGLLGNDRAFIRYTQIEQAAGQPEHRQARLHGDRRCPRAPAGERHRLQRPGGPARRVLQRRRRQRPHPGPGRRQRPRRPLRP